MPLPQRVARFNRRVTNPVLSHIAGWMPPFAFLIHTGRRSGRIYRIPIMVFRGGDGYRIALTYGAETDWVRNVLAAGGCTIEIRGKHIALTNPRIVDDPRQRWAPPVIRQLLGVQRAPHYMQLATAHTTRNGPARAEER